ncbi:MAG: class I SAM-dependent methyltransferase [Desulfatitalea sp.]|nr:class I SAM-dependent methyltransferase [Desulfatitalea sp.]NNK01951.1 class I SAM-dependent methyltransferase [Desulfatitalea sp.]
MAEEKAYTQAATTGKYDKASGLLGKYDNVRRFWEDQLTGLFLRPALNDLVTRKNECMERIRVLDLGCGNGDGYDLIMDVNTKDPGLYEFITAALTPERLQTYVGVDINEELLCQAESCFGVNPKMQFMREDLSDGLTENITRHEPFDLYFSSYGTWSHFHDEQAVKLVADIARHAPDRAIFVGDWLGRWSYEWQDLWDAPLDEAYFMDYRISYIYPKQERDKVKVASFPLRLMCQEEIQHIIDRAEKEAGCRIRPVKYFDRSILVGRHLETGDYNANCPALRYGINSLFEGYTRTDLETLIVDHVPRRGYDFLNNFFESFFMAANTLVRHTIALLSHYDSEKGVLTSIPEIRSFYPEPLKEAMYCMQRIIEGVGWLTWGDVRANVIESHLGFSLRKLEMELQPGIGVGHSLCGIFEIRKD